MIIPRITSVSIKDLNKKLNSRQSSATYQWKKDVKERDNHMCKWPHCYSDKDLEIHHIKRWADYKHLRWNVSNGITLCKKHHDLVTGRERLYEIFLMKLVSKEFKTKYDLQNKNKDPD